MANKRFRWRKPDWDRHGRSDDIDLTYGGVMLGEVRYQNGYYWVFHGDNLAKGVPSHNSLWTKTRYATVEEAKDACLAHARAAVAKLEES